MTLTDPFLQQGKRHQMVNALREKGITQKRVLEAMEQVPRHWFVDPSFSAMAYEDRAIKIDCDQTISHPSTVAMQSQLLMLEPNMKVLEIGTGSGYQAAVLCAMGARVFTIERQRALYEKTSVLLRQAGYRAQCFLGDGYKGLAGSYDRILVTCGAPEVPQTLLGQLKVGGIMVIPLGNENHEMWRITKQGPSPDDLLTETFGTYNFVPMLEGKTRY